MYAYIGAGMDIERPTHLFGQNIIFVDSQPFTEFNNNFFYRRGFYRERFADFIDKYKDAEMKIKPDNLVLYPCWIKKRFLQPHLISLKNGNTYYISSHFKKRMSNSLRIALGNCDKLILCGYAPPPEILKYMKSPVTFYIDGDGIALSDPRKGHYGKYYKINGETILGWLWEKYDKIEKVKIILYKKKGKYNINTEFYEFDNIKDCWEIHKPSYS